MATDKGAILQLVWSAKLDPTQLKWSQFWVIEQHEEIIACGQLREFADAQELGSLVVIPNVRDQGLGTLLAQHLIQEASQPLYLECLGNRLSQFYGHLGFSPVAWADLPSSLQGKFRLSRLARAILRVPIQFMHYDSPSS